MYLLAWIVIGARRHSRRISLTLRGLRRLRWNDHHNPGCNGRRGASDCARRLHQRQKNLRPSALRMVAENR